jgi:hypothetical protein
VGEGDVDGTRSFCRQLAGRVTDMSPEYFVTGTKVASSPLGEIEMSFISVAMVASIRSSKFKGRTYQRAARFIKFSSSKRHAAYSRGIILASGVLIGTAHIGRGVTPVYRRSLGQRAGSSKRRQL